MVVILSERRSAVWRSGKEKQARRFARYDNMIYGTASKLIRHSSLSMETADQLGFHFRPPERRVWTVRALVSAVRPAAFHYPL